VSDRRTGRFITLEGGEGAGKSTQAKRLAASLGTSGIQVVTTREPGGSPGAEEIRKLLLDGATGRWDPVAELLLHFAARRDHLLRTIQPALDRGDWVICDRFADSTMAYQGYGLELGPVAVERVRDIAIGDTRPDLTLILDLPVEAGLARAGERDGTAADQNRYERMDEAFHHRLRDGFLAIARAEPDRCVVIDAAMDMDAVHGEICSAVADRLGVTLGTERQ
jgi:dTMP kinase